MVPPLGKGGSDLAGVATPGVRRSEDLAGLEVEDDSRSDSCASRSAEKSSAAAGESHTQTVNEQATSASSQTPQPSGPSPLVTSSPHRHPHRPSSIFSSLCRFSHSPPAAGAFLVALGVGSVAPPAVGPTAAPVFCT